MCLCTELLLSGFLCKMGKNDNVLAVSWTETSNLLETPLVVCQLVLAKTC